MTAADSAVNGWLEANTFECQKLQGRFTQEQCRLNRERALGMQFPGLLAPCVTCQGDSRMKETVEKKRPGRPKGGYRAGKAIPEKTSPSPVAESKEKTLLSLVILKPSDPPAPPGFFVDFTGHEDLLARVQSSSEDVNGDILVVLQALLDRKLYSHDDVFGMMCHV